MVKKIVLAVVVLVLFGLGALFILRNILVEQAVEVGSEYALGVKTELGSASLELGGTSLELSELEIDNPDGFEGERFLTLHRAVLDVDAGLLMDGTVPVDSLVIDGVALNLIQVDGRGNYRTILDHVKAISAEPSSGDEPRFHFALIAVRDVAVTGSLTMLGQPPVKKSYTVPDFELRDVGGADGATVSEVTGTIVRSVVSRALAAGSGVLPDGFGEKLSGMAEEQKDKAKEAAKEKLESAAKSLLGGGK